MVLAIALLTSSAATAQTSVKYIHADALGSVAVVTGQNRQVLEHREYEPYGAQLVPVPQDGPGYTGHVQDAATGLVYMQQRYYDPVLGVFLSVDPVTAYQDPISQFHRYRYANNNPYKFTDPDGRRIVFALRNGATFSDQAATMSYLGSSSTAASEILQLHHSNETYTILFDRGSDTAMGYDHDSRTITVNPTSGLRVESLEKIQSPALGGAHEISHAAEHDRVGTQGFVKSLEAPILSVKDNSGGGITVTYGVSQEEKRATNVESRIAHELGEAARKDYLDQQGAVTTCGPTSTSTTGC